MAGFLRDWFFPEHMVPAGSEGLVYCFSDVASGGLWYTTRRSYLCGRRRETLAVPLADHPERHRVNRPGGVCCGALLGLPGEGDHGSRQARNPAGRPFLSGRPEYCYSCWSWGSPRSAPICQPGFVTTPSSMGG